MIKDFTKKINQIILGVNLIIITGSSVYLCWFFYQNIYQPCYQTSEIITLKKSVMPEKIDLVRFNDIIKSLESKTVASTTDGEIKNLFGN
jgi:hypothetical protein